MDVTNDNIPMDLVRSYDESEFRITHDGHFYSIVNTSIPMTIADGFFAWLEALVFLEEKQN